MELKRPIPITITRDGDGVVAGFLDANISTGADSVPEAIADLQSLLVDVFEELDAADNSILGPEMLRQKRVLTEVMCRVRKKQPTSFPAALGMTNTLRS